MPCGAVPLQDEGSKGWRERSAVRDKGSSDLKCYLWEQGGGRHYWCLDKQCVEAVWVSDSSWTATANALTHVECQHHPLLQNCSHSGWGCRHLEGTEPSQPQLFRASALATRDLSPSPTGWWLLRQRETSTYIWLWFQPLHFQPHLLPRL